jgi:hypothetical protein
MNLTALAESRNTTLLIAVNCSVQSPGVIPQLAATPLKRPVPPVI